MEMVQRSGQRGVPVITVDDDVIVGFDRPRLEQSIARRRGAAKPGLGLKVAPTRTAHGLPPGTPDGLHVGGVRPGSPAAQAGFKTGDVILRVAGTPVSSAEELSARVQAAKQSGPVEVAVWREGREIPLDLKG